MITNITECGLLQRCVDFSISRSLAICLHQVQPEMGNVEDKNSPPLLQVRWTPLQSPLKYYVALKMKLNS